MTAWQSVLIAFGGSSALLAVLGWLAKSLVEKLLAKDVEQFKASLASESAAAVEKLRHELQVAAVEHQVRFSKLHEKRASVIAELYGLLVQACWEAESFASPMEWSGEPKKQDKYATAMNAVTDFFKFFDKHKIYLPSSLCNQLSDFVTTIRTKVIYFGSYVDRPDERVPEHVLKEKHKVWMEAWDYMKNQAPPAREALEKELRGLLGAKSD